MKGRGHDNAMTKLFEEDPAFAADCLNQLLRDGEPSDLLAALRQMAHARGGARALAKETIVMLAAMGAIEVKLNPVRTEIKGEVLEAYKQAASMSVINAEPGSGGVKDFRAKLNDEVLRVCNRVLQ